MTCPLDGRLAQLVEHLVYTEGVGSSSLSAPTILQDTHKRPVTGAFFMARFCERAHGLTAQAFGGFLVYRHFNGNFCMTATSTLAIKELMCFVPSGPDYAQALRFYEELGFSIAWESPELAILQYGAHRFFLQNFTNVELQQNYMMHLAVEDLDAWWEKLSALNLPEKYAGVRLKPPQIYPWGMREIHLIDPAGVLWHIAMPVTPAEDA